MNISDNTIYVIGIDQDFLLEDVYDSMEEAIEDIESPDKCHAAFKYTRKDHSARVYKTSPRELSRFYKEFMLHEIPYPKKYFKTHLVQVYPDPFNDYTINELAERKKDDYTMESKSMNNNNISDIKLRDTDMNALKCVLQHCSKEIYDTTRSHSGYEIASCAVDTLELIILMKRAIELMDDLYSKNTSLSV